MMSPPPPQPPRKPPHSARGQAGDTDIAALSLPSSASDPGAAGRRIATETTQVVASEFAVALTPRRRLTTTTTVYVSDQSELSTAINGATTDTTIVLQTNITLTAAGSTSSKFTISGKTGLVIDGAGYTLGFNSSDSSNGRVFYIESSSSVEMRDLRLENGYITSTVGFDFVVHESLAYFPSD